jgi:hypothetical protein
MLASMQDINRLYCLGVQALRYPQTDFQPDTACTPGSTVLHFHASPTGRVSISLSPVLSNQEHAKQSGLLSGPKAKVKFEERQMHLQEVQAKPQQMMHRHGFKNVVLR